MQIDSIHYAKTEEVTAQSVSHRGVVVLIPAYNEERFIGSVVLRAHKWADKVFVVDDGSSDTTAEIAIAAGAVVIRHTRNLGKGVALNTGLHAIRELNPDIVIMLDGDGQHVPDEIHVVIEPILSGAADIVVGSRYLEKKSRVPLLRVWGHQAFNFMTNQASGVHLSDTQSGFRALSPRALEAIRFHSKGFSVESEMQFLASDRKLKMMEVPISIQYLDKPKRSLMVHGLMVLDGVMHLAGQYRPLLFFGLTGLLLALMALGSAIFEVNQYLEFRTLAVGYVLFSVVLFLSGIFFLFTGIILHSIRGLLIDLIAPRETGEKQA